MPINVRYTDVGDLGALAVQAGEGQAFNRRFAQEQQIANSVRSYYANQDALRLEAQKLQQAVNVSRTPTARQNTQRDSAVSRSVAGEKDVELSTAALGFNQAEKEALAIALKNGDRDLARSLINKGLQGGVRDATGTGFVSGPGGQAVAGEGQVAPVLDAAGGLVPGVGGALSAAGTAFQQAGQQQGGGFVQFDRGGGGLPAAMLTPERVDEMARPLVEQGRLSTQDVAYLKGLVQQGADIDDVRIAASQLVREARAERTAEQRVADLGRREAIKQFDRTYDRLTDKMGETQKKIKNLQDSVAKIGGFSGPRRWTKIVDIQGTPAHELEGVDRERRRQYVELLRELSELEAEREQVEQQGARPPARREDTVQSGDVLDLGGGITIRRKQ